MTNRIPPDTNFNFTNRTTHPQEAPASTGVTDTVGRQAIENQPSAISLEFEQKFIALILDMYCTYNPELIRLLVGLNLQEPMTLHSMIDIAQKRLDAVLERQPEIQQQRAEIQQAQAEIQQAQANIWQLLSQS